MNKISCNVIGDLLPLYVDGAVSEDTKKLVEEHLAECEECKKAAEEMGKELVLPVHETVRAAETSFLQKMKKTAAAATTAKERTERTSGRGPCFPATAHIPLLQGKILFR